MAASVNNVGNDSNPASGGGRNTPTTGGHRRGQGKKTKLIFFS